MDQERQEVFERIPWETLEKPRRDFNWVVIALAGAVIAGVLAFSFVRGRPADSAPVSAAPAEVGTVATVATPAATPPPLVMAEADLFAVDGERLIDQVAAHAEWFAVEYISYDGSEESRAILASLLPEGVPTPEAVPGTQVFVDWVGAGLVTEAAPLVYTVEVMVRSLASDAEGVFLRQAPVALAVEVMIGEDGEARVTRPPAVVDVAVPPSPPLPYQALPEGLVADLPGVVVGGEPLADGTWRVVTMVADGDGVTRPRTVILP